MRFNFPYQPTARFTAIISILLLVASCQRALTSLMGIKNLKEFNATHVDEQANRMMAAYDGSKMSFVLDEHSLFDLQNLTDSLYKNDLLQPLQLFYFQSDKLISYQVNCRAKSGLTGNINWNVLNRFDQYFPVSAAVIEHEKWGLSELIKELKIPLKELSKNEDYIVFFWTNMMEKQSLATNQVVIDHIEKYGSTHKRPTLLYLNTDKFWVKQQGL